MLMYLNKWFDGLGRHDQAIRRIAIWFAFLLYTQPHPSRSLERSVSHCTSHFAQMSLDHFQKLSRDFSGLAQ